MSDPDQSRSMFSIWSGLTVLVYLVLLTLAVPWYWQYLPDVAVSIRCGMPTWVLVSLLGSTGISAFTAWLLWRSPWPLEGESENGISCKLK